MLARLDMKLNVSKYDIFYQMSSTFHGVLMELLPEEYAAELHVSRRHPYAQHIERQGDEWHWIITALNEDTAQRLLQQVLMKVNDFTVKKHQLHIKVIEKNYQELSDSNLAKSFYQEQAGKYIMLQFVTPTTFKHDGRYVNFPDVHRMFSNIMKKFDAINPDEKMYDEDTLEQLVEHTVMSRYELRSTVYSLEGVRIPAFIGKITLKMCGSQTMINFANMLFDFASYSGIGVKTAMGMGAIKILGERTGTNERKAN